MGTAKLFGYLISGCTMPEYKEAGIMGLYKFLKFLGEGMGV